MKPGARLAILHKDAIATMHGHKATVTSTVLGDHGMVRVAFHRNQSEHGAGLTSADLTLAQAKRLRTILDAAIAAASVGPADAAPHANGAARDAAGGNHDVRHAEG